MGWLQSVLSDLWPISAQASLNSIQIGDVAKPATDLTDGMAY